MKTGLKKSISVIICLIMLLGVIGIGSLTVSADNPTSGRCGDNLAWEYDETTFTLTITGNSDMYDYAYPNSTIQPWYNYLYEIEKIIISDGVTSIGGYAFSSCTNLTQISIADTVTSIGKFAFAYCSSLSKITVPDSVTNIGGYLFCDCTNLTDISVPDCFYSGDGTFSHCSSLTDLIIPDGVYKIGKLVFCDCGGLERINIPDTVTTISKQAFEDCVSLKSISIPSSVESIDGTAFNGCVSVESIIVNKNNPIYYSSGDCLIDKRINKLVVGCKNSIIPSDGTVITIGESAFSDCSSLEYMTIPSFVSTIQGWAFSNCSGLKSVVILGDVSSIETGTFLGTTSLESIYIPISVKKINSKAFKDSSLKSVYYEGSALDKINIDFLNDNSSITDAKWYFNSSPNEMISYNRYTLTYNANGGSGAPGNQTGSGYVSISNTKPTRSGYTFLGWATTSSAISAQYNAGSLINLDKDITLYAVWQKNTTPDNPDNPNPPTPDIPEANVIRGNSADNKKTYNYRTTVTFTANVPEGGSVQWYVDGSPAGNGSTLSVKDKTNDYTVKVVVTDKNGNQTMDEEQVTIKHGFFDILIWFFVHLFNPGAYDVKQ